MTRRTRDDEIEAAQVLHTLNSIERKSKTYGDDLSLPTSGKNITMLWAYIKNVGAKPEETRLKR